MAKLTAAERNALPARDFVFPKKRKYPIEDAAHARDAESRAGHQGGSVEAKVDAAVHRKFPAIGKRGKKKSKAKKAMRRAPNAFYGDSDHDYD